MYLSGDVPGFGNCANVTSCHQDTTEYLLQFFVIPVYLPFVHHGKPLVTNPESKYIHIIGHGCNWTGLFILTHLMFIVKPVDKFLSHSRLQISIGIQGIIKTSHLLPRDRQGRLRVSFSIIGDTGGHRTPDLTHYKRTIYH